MNLYRKFISTLFFIIFVMAGCGSMNNSKPTPAITLSNTEIINPTNTISISPSPSETLSPTMILPTTTEIPQAYDLMDNYLFPADIYPKIAEVIQAALEERLSYSSYRGEQFFSYALFLPLEKTDDGIIKAYLQAKHRVFYVAHGEIKENGGGDIPAVVTMEEKENGWRIEVDTPQMGNWGPSIREMFPEEILPLIFDHSYLSKPVFEAINKNIVQQAEEHFGLVFDADKNSFLTIHNDTPEPSISILTLTPTPTTDISVLEPDVSTRVFINDEYISIGVNLYRERITPFQRGLLSSGWIVYLYKRQADNNYSIQNAIDFDDTKKHAGSSEFSVLVPLEQVHRQFGDTRSLIYQVVDKTGKVFLQDDIYLDTELSHQYPDNPEKDFSNDYREDVTEGVIIGNPNLLSSNISPVFIPNEDFIIIKEPQGGFHSLTYSYNFGRVEGITATSELDNLSKTLIVEVFPYREDGLYVSANKTVLSKKIPGVSGILSAQFPHEWLDKKRDNAQNFYLRIADENGNILKEAYLHFIPYIQQ